MDYTPIQCQLYDFIEIACMKHYTLEIELLDNEKITAKALTTLIKDKQEFLIISNEQREEQSLRLDTIKAITPLNENAEFKRVEIN